MALRKWLRDRTDPFAVSNTEFIRLYRMPQHYVFELAEILRPHMRPGIRSHFVPVEIKVSEFCRDYFLSMPLLYVVVVVIE